MTSTKTSQEKNASRAKIAKDAKIEFGKKLRPGGGLCELSVLGAIDFHVVLSRTRWGVRI
jgi:hypothetical protein